MTKTVNKAILVGRVGKDPVFAQLPNSTVAQFSLATTYSIKDKATGIFSEQTEWHRIVTYNKLAEIITKYVVKGALLYVEGTIKTRKYTDKTGIEKNVTEIIAHDINILHTPRSHMLDADGHIETNADSEQQQGNPSKDDDLPF